MVSSPERALLELLSDVGVRQPPAGSTGVGRKQLPPARRRLHELLKRCTSVKTVRLCLQFGRELSLPWATKLDTTDLPTGSDKAWVSRSAEGLLVLKP